MSAAKVLRNTTGAVGLGLLACTSIAASVEPHDDKVVMTQHEIRVRNSVKLQYAAHAGVIPLYANDTGERMASMFFIGYIVERARNQPSRPITFLWNGGPGSNSAQIHFMGFGPRRPALADSYPEVGPNTEAPVVDNPDTWLAQSDLVFIDPVGTGFSRATSEKNRQALYTMRGDAEAVTEAIRILLTRFDRWDAPLFIGGESYGTTRATLVAEALQRRRLKHADGVLLISGGFNVGQELAESLRQALAITEFTAIAHYHRRLPPDLQALSQHAAIEQAAEWARTTFAPALARLSTLNDSERSSILAALSRYTGVSATDVNAKTLQLDGATFADRLLAEQGLELGRYDGRMKAPARPAKQTWLPTGDPSLEPMAGLMNGTSRVFNSYIRHELGFESDLLYQGPFGGGFHPEPLETDPRTGLPSDWMAARFQFETREENSEPPLKRAMILNPRLQVLILNGLYDGSCVLTDEAVARAEESLRRRVRHTCMAGGHMFYSDLSARRAASDAFADFVGRATAPDLRTRESD